MVEINNKYVHVTIRDGQVQLRLRKKRSPDWNPAPQADMRCPFGVEGYELLISLDSMHIRNSDGAEIAESKVVDLDEVRKQGISIQLPDVLRRFTERGWVTIP